MGRGEIDLTLKERSISILMVEDSEDDAFLLYSELIARGVKVDYRRVDNSADLRTALACEEWDVIICDHNMPGFDSGSALAILKETGKDVPFIIYSGNISDHQAVCAMREGVSDYVHKGNFAKLLPVIERELRGAATRRAVRQADHRIRELAYYDALSSLPNHNLFCARVTEWIFDAQKQGRDPSGALFYIDVDRFLRINSSFGYEAGNDILRQAAKRLAECVDSNAILARLGGDEFGIFYPGLGRREAARNFGQWVLQAFEAPFLRNNLELYLTVSVGIALAPEDSHEVYELLMNAETAMAHAKRSGGNGFRFYIRDMNATSAERIAMESELRHAVEREELFLQYQPCLCASAAKTMGVEALVRWRHPQRGLVSPERFVPIADESGLIVDIGEWVLRQSCMQGREWHDRGFTSLSVSVNVSAVQFAQPRLLEVVSRALRDTGFSPECLTLEITESVIMHDAESAAGMLRALKGMGVKIAVDDFGTGYSSLSYLKRFPIDVLKIDKSFVQAVATNDEDVAIVRAIIALAKSLHLVTIAEGVETRQQAEFLRREGCDRFQGYYFSRPMDANHLVERLSGEEGRRLLH